MILSNGRGETFREDNSSVFFSSPSEREKSMIIKESAALSFSMALVFFLSYFLQTLFMGAGRLINKDLICNDLFKELTVLISYAVSMSVPFSLFASFTKLPVKKALKTRKTGTALTFACLCVALGVSVVGMFSSVALTFLLSHLGIVFSLPLSYIPKSMGAFLLYILNMTVVPAVLEEMAFRGFVLQSLRRFGDGFALFVSAFCFALLHVNPTRFPHTFVMGLVIGYFVLFTGSLATGIIIHFVYNAIITIMSIATDFGFAESTMLMASGEVVMLVLALAGLFYLLRNYKGMFTLRKGRSVNPAAVNIKVFLSSRGMIVFYILILVMSLRSLVIQ